MNRERLIIFGLCLLMAWLVPRVAGAHPMDNASLVLQEQAPSQFMVHFRAGSPSLAALDVPAVYPRSCRVKSPQLSCGPAGLSGTLEFPWLEGSSTRLLLDVQWQDGSRLVQVITGDHPEVTVYDHRASGLAALWPVLSDYTVLGIGHILFGFDHLCFVISLAFLVRGRRRLIATITAFTVAHSLTLAATALGIVEVPILPVEAMIALSILLVCAECLRSDESLTRRAPWSVAFAFGLLHGFGFASALLDIGLPEKHLPGALLGFNFGVELGQVAVVLALLLLQGVGKRWDLGRPWMTRSVIYAMGSLAGFWSLDRTWALLGLVG